MLSDSELLRRYADEQDQSAFAEVVRRNLDIVYNAALRRVHGSSHLAEEAAQAVFIQLACKASALKRHPALLGWLHMSTRYAASTLLRTEQRRIAREQQAAAMHLDSADPPTVNWEKLRPMIDEMLDELSEFDRQVLLLRYFAGRSFPEIGAELRLSEEASRKRVARALEILRDKFNRRGVVTTGAALAVILEGVPLAAAPATLATSITTSAVTVAGTAMAGSTASATVAFMGTAKLAGVVVVTCSLLGLGAALLTWNQQLQTRERQLGRMQDQATAARNWLHDRIRLSAAAKNAKDATQTPKIDSTTADRNLSANLQQNYRALQTLLTSPAYAGVRDQEFRLLAEREFGAFFASRQYPPEKAAAVRKAIARFHEREMSAVAATALVPDDGPSISDRIEIERQRLVDELAPVLSRPEIEDVRHCLVAQQWMPIARNIALDLSDGGARPSEVQTLALGTIISESETAVRSASPAVRAAAEAIDPKTGMTAHNRDLLDDAAAFLSPAQLALFESYLRDDQESSALADRVRAQVLATTKRP